MDQQNHNTDDGPLERILADHGRQLQLLTSLEQIIEAEDSIEMTRFAPELLAFFNEDLARHMIHEEKGLFPMLKQRCRPTDDLDLIVGQLSYEHDLDRDLVDFLLDDLKKIAHGHHTAIPARFNINAQAFVETQRRHIAWENRIVIPLAKKRLEQEDLDNLETLMNAD
jgi:hemerythrin-like domain-containing protein